jgi:methyl acetate hydrolase
MNRRQFLGAAAAAAIQARQSRADGIGDVLQAGIARRKIPCAVGMVASGTKTLYSGAFGVRDDGGTPVKVDSIFGIASMTKAITTVAAMQLVEQGKVKLDEPAGKYLPQLAKLDVLESFDAQGKPVLRPAKTPVTLKHLLTHTSGFCYDMWDEKMSRYTKVAADSPVVGPLMFEPGARWQYGQGLDWAGRLVEAVSGMSLEDYFQAKICRPLEMADTSYILPPAKFDRMVQRWNRDKGPELQPTPRVQPQPPKAYNGGGGLYSTAADYVKFMQMILAKGRGILRPATVASMEVNQIGPLTAGKMKTSNPSLSSDVDIQPGFPEKWGLGFLINTTAYTGGRAAGSLAWAGLYNTFYWIDPKNNLCAVILMQFLPFVDREAVGMLNDFEHAVYASIAHPQR